MFSKTSDYDATERLVNQTAFRLMKMKPRTEAVTFTSCYVLNNKTDPEVQIVFDQTLEYPIGFLNNSLAREKLTSFHVDPSYFDEPFKDDFAKEVMKDIGLNALEMYFYFIYL